MSPNLSPLYHERLPYLAPLNWGIYYEAGRKGLIRAHAALSCVSVRA
jgi:hypothetical protein